MSTDPAEPRVAAIAPLPGTTLGMDGGGTKTTWVTLTPDGKPTAEGAAGPGNTLLLDDAQLRRLFESIRAKAGESIEAIGATFAGCQVDSEVARVRRAIQEIWPSATTVIVDEDTASALAGAFGTEDGICVIAGTGSNVIGRRGGELAKAGGRGHLFSDEGSAYDLVRRALQEVFYTWDEKQHVSVLGQIFLRHSMRNSLNELVAWILNHGSKREIAALAPCVFEAAQSGDLAARRVIRKGATSLAERVVLVGRRLKLKLPSVGLTGGLFEKQPEYETAFRRALYTIYPGSKVFVSRLRGAYGAAAMIGAKARLHGGPVGIREDEGRGASTAGGKLATTEERNPRSKGLQKRAIPELVDLFIDEERYIEDALRAQREPLAAACACVAERLQRGGRLFYIGAGTSGRLGILDASEMPPTFNAPPEMIQGIIAGGAPAVFRSQEGAEDSEEAGARTMRQRGIEKGDVVCGLAASGTTPFVRAALAEAKRLGAATIFVTCNPNRPPCDAVDFPVDLPTGPELVTGSTRLKAGTATKAVLNMLSTIAMIRQGRVHDNLMIDVQATNAKLRGRAIRLVRTICGLDEAEAEKRLEARGWSVREVVEHDAEDGS